MKNMKNMFQDTISQIKGLVSNQQPSNSTQLETAPLESFEVVQTDNQLSESPSNIIQIDTRIKKEEEVIEPDFSCDKKG